MVKVPRVRRIHGVHGVPKTIKSIKVTKKHTGYVKKLKDGYGMYIYLADNWHKQVYSDEYAAYFNLCKLNKEIMREEYNVFLKPLMDKIVSTRLKEGQGDSRRG